MNGSPPAGTNKAAVVNALSNYATDINSFGVAFLFANHDDLALAKQLLGDSTVPGECGLNKFKLLYDSATHK